MSAKRWPIGCLLAALFMEASLIPSTVSGQGGETAGMITEIRNGRGKVEVRAAGGADWRAAGFLQAVRAGQTAGRVDRAARRVLERAGLGSFFTHSTGHGLGIEVHEGPRLGRGQAQEIRVGNVVTLEPGIYVEGVGGIRIEDDVAVHASGPEVLTSTPTGLIEI